MNKISRRFAEALRGARQTRSHVIERVKLMFSLSLEQRRKSAGLTYSDLAKRMETSPAYITKVFRGDSNLTIETMVKLALATGSEVDIRLVEPGSARAAWDLSKFDNPPRAGTTTPSTVVHVDFSAANHDRYARLSAA